MAKCKKGKKILLGIFIVAVAVAVIATVVNFLVYKSLLKIGSEYNKVEIENPKQAPIHSANNHENIRNNIDYSHYFSLLHTVCVGKKKLYGVIVQ